MTENLHGAFIAKWLAYYKGLNKIRCVALNEVISFGNSGFTHLIRKNGKERPLHVSHSRLRLLSLIHKILSDPRPRLETRIVKSKKHGALTFIAMTSNIDGRLVRVVIRKFGAGSLHFFSIMKVR